MQTKKGQSIEDASMQMIEDEIGSHSYNEKEWPIVRRIIHSTADFDFAEKNKLIFHKDAIESGMKALKNGCSIVVDVNGVIGGLNKQNPKDFGNDIVCNISKPEIMELAKKEGKTRSGINEGCKIRYRWRNHSHRKRSHSSSRGNKDGKRRNSQACANHRHSSRLYLCCRIKGGTITTRGSTIYHKFGKKRR